MFKLILGRVEELLFRPGNVQKNAFAIKEAIFESVKEVVSIEWLKREIHVPVTVTW